MSTLQDGFRSRPKSEGYDDTSSRGYKKAMAPVDKFFPRITQKKET